MSDWFPVGEARARARALPSDGSLWLRVPAIRYELGAGRRIAAAVTP